MFPFTFIVLIPFALAVINLTLKRDSITHSRRNYNQQSEKIYHAHYTAYAIEESIREIRRQDYPLREKYQELLNEKN